MINTYYLDKVIEDPTGAYEEFKIRLEKYGNIAPFPEFKESVDHIIAAINDDRITEIIKNIPSLLLEKKEVLTFLFHLNLSFYTEPGIEYPYAHPFKESYPYRPTIDAIEQGLRFLDKISRISPDSKAVKLYHFDRYCYHRHSVLTSDDVVIFPTFRELTMLDFIKTRSVPIEFVGIITDTLRVDGHHQSPLDFWYHDFNHARRLLAYISNSNKANDYTTILEKLKHYRSMHRFTEDFILPRFCTIKEQDDLEMMAIKKVCTLIIFEIVHETALTMERESIINDLLRKTGPQPFEYMSNNEDEDIELYRTPLGNLMSGAQHHINKNLSGIKIKYILDKTSIGLLANVYNKINFYYYDDAGSVDESLLETKYRAKDFLLKAVKYMLSNLDPSMQISDNQILELINDTSESKEKAILKAVSSEIEQTQTGTDPLNQTEAIELITKDHTDRKILTLFGFSALGYDKEFELKTKAKELLLNYDKNEYVICIGATEDGVGCLYDIAKELEFETIGIVSTLALSYSGKFSNSVEKIYIINDDLWGGYKINGELTPTTEVFLGISDQILAFGGGNNTLVTLQNAKLRNIRYEYYPFEMKHTDKVRPYDIETNGYNGHAYSILKS